jgi:hypothetical protein
MSDVQNLPNNVESIVGGLKTVNFANQDLDVLIELSKQLKFKRLELFPEEDYMLTLQEATVPNYTFKH